MEDGLAKRDDFIHLKSRSRTNQFACKAICVVLLFSIFLFSAAHPLQGPSGDKSFSALQKGVVTYIYDGDTFRIRLPEGERRVRLLGVDAPEIGHPSEEIDLWARLAKKFAQIFLLRKVVTLSYEAERQDSYGRLLAYIWLEDKTLYNEKIIGLGLADFFSRASLGPDIRERLRQAEEKARREKKGKWQQNWPPPIEDIEAKNHYGEFQTVNLICQRIKAERTYTLILSRRSDFQVFIPGDRRPFFSILKLIKPGDKLSVFGLIEEYHRRPQVVLFSPLQIKIN